MTALPAADVQKALEFFDRTLERIVQATHGLSEAQWHFEPAVDRWSIAQIVEHMVIVEEQVLGPLREQLAQAPAPPADRDHHLVDRVVMERIPDRSIKARGPDFVRPAGQLRPPAALDRVFQNYKRLATLLESAADLRGHMMEAAPLRIVTRGEFTTMDGYQWALALAAHDERHVRQILEVQADPNYPQTAAGHNA